MIVAGTGAIEATTGGGGGGCGRSKTGAEMIPDTNAFTFVPGGICVSVPSTSAAVEAIRGSGGNGLDDVSCGGE